PGCGNRYSIPAMEFRNRVIGGDVRDYRNQALFRGITGNSVALIKFWRGIRGRWMKWLRRRSHAAYAKNWIWWSRFHERYPLPPARAIHSIFSRT
ncbi:MAG: hypothetical protein ACI9F9_001244, partial [Candidatus Paceibacteria bacterium]